MLTAGDLGCFGCPVLLDFSNSGNSTCCNHDGEEVVAIDISGKVDSLTAISSDENKKLPAHSISTLGIVQKVPSTTNTTIHKNHHHGRAIHPSYGMGLKDPPDPMQVTSSKGVGQGRCCGVLHALIN